MVESVLLELNRQLDSLRCKLCDVEDWHHSDEEWQRRDSLIRTTIKGLERLRDLIPVQDGGST